MKLHPIAQPVAVVAYTAPFVLLAAVSRDQFAELILSAVLLFAMYGFWLFKRPPLSWNRLIAVVLLLRLPFFFHLPQLSDDFYRFLWDGLMLTEGINPFGAVPVDTELGIFSDPAFAEKLLAGMNSREYGSVYPPLHQAVFWVGAQLSGGSLLSGVNAMRGVILLAELGMAVYFARFSGLRNGVLLAAAYLFNPLVIAEGVGNVHMEALMVPLLAVGLHMLLPVRASLSTQKAVKGSLFFAGSVLVKLTPLLLAPLLFFREKGMARWKMTGIIAAVILLAFLPFSPWRLLDGLDQSFGLYFSTFEFNASVYYLLREAITPLLGYNPIGVLGPALGLVSVVVVLWLAFAAKRFDFYTAALYSYVAFYLLSTTVHPWYLLPVVYLGLAAKRPVWLVWSFAVWFSYSHYAEPVGSKWGWTVLEYGLIGLALIAGRHSSFLSLPGFLVGKGEMKD